MSQLDVREDGKKLNPTGLPCTCWASRAKPVQTAAMSSRLC